ncbi:hypothetical protein [Tautonia plasticadhaerens]|uniref:Twin-arginine translocation signal domain-containing protein n=1 Tax=Tautonia plasticadhaerens TaxID=2527974 RepID=A0A518HA87_9BACT|nr:hypothetical protein [Tautonia plasticadhaerens]QDV37749.1 hypothetical protein ElP_56950 [Tautonia plasticadhaerens]
MPRTTRRRFFEESMIAAATAVSAGSYGRRLRAQAPGRGSPNDRIRHAVIGCRIRGRVHADQFGRQEGDGVAYVGPLPRIDPDRESLSGAPEADALLTREYRRPFVVPNEREV